MQQHLAITPHGPVLGRVGDAFAVLVNEQLSWAGVAGAALSIDAVSGSGWAVLSGSPHTPLDPWPHSSLLLRAEIASLNCLPFPSPLLERYRTFFRPRYKIGYKTVTELAWRCCPGFMGEGCHDSPTDQPGLMPQHPGPKMPPGPKMFPLPRVPPHPKSHPDLFAGPKKNQYGETLLLLCVPTLLHRWPWSQSSQLRVPAQGMSLADLGWVAFVCGCRTSHCFQDHFSYLLRFKMCGFKIAVPHCFKAYDRMRGDGLKLCQDGSG